jgi:hypothetical protein
VGLADNGFFTVAPYRELFLARAQAMYSVEIGCDAEDLATVMSEMREWLDAQRFEPDIFRHNVARESITIHVQFKVESKAVAFAQAFSGQLVKLSRRQPRSLRGARAAAR